MHCYREKKVEHMAQKWLANQNNEIEQVPVLWRRFSCLFLVCFGTRSLFIKIIVIIS